MGWQDDADVVSFSGPIQAKKDCKLRIDFAEGTTWKVKESVPSHAGEEYKAIKLTCTITDENIQTEGENIKPRLVLEHQFNLDRYPYLSKKTGAIEWLGRQNLYDLEEAFGFDPIFVNGDGSEVEPYVTRNGRKVAPKVEGVKRKLNAAFTAAYFNEYGIPTPDAWINREVYADIGIEANEQYGDRNRILRFKKAPVSV